MFANEICPICHDNDKSLISLPCNHKYHAICIYKWLIQSNFCPMRCTTEITKEMKKNIKMKFSPQENWEYLIDCKIIIKLDNQIILKELSFIEEIMSKTKVKFVKLDEQTELFSPVKFTGNRAEIMLEGSKFYFEIKNLKFYSLKESLIQIILTPEYVNLLTTMAQLFARKAKTSSNLKILTKKESSICISVENDASVFIQDEDNVKKLSLLEKSVVLKKSPNGFGTFGVTMTINEYDCCGDKKCFTCLNCNYLNI